MSQGTSKSGGRVGGGAGGRKVFGFSGFSSDKLFWCLTTSDEEDFFDWSEKKFKKYNILNEVTRVALGITRFVL
jgi:hypothetical protein